MIKASWGGTGRLNLPCPLQSVCYSHTFTLKPPRVSSLRRLHGHHNHVLQASVGHQLPGSIPQRPTAVGERMGDRQRCLDELCHVLREGRNAFLQAPTSTAVRGANPVGRNNSLSGVGGVTLDTRLTPSSNVDQVRKEAAQRPGVLGPLLKKSRSLAIGNGVLLYKQLIQPMMDYACPKCRFATRTHSLPISEP